MASGGVNYLDTTAIVRLQRPADGYVFTRADIVQLVDATVGFSHAVAIGQLGNPGTWEVVLADTASKLDFIQRATGRRVHGKEIRSITSLRNNIHDVRVLNVHYCIPHSTIAAELIKRGARVLHYQFQTPEADDTIASNVRLYKVQIDDWDKLGDEINYTYEGIYGVGHVQVKGRRPRCHACGSRRHLMAECPQPYCRNCRETGHLQGPQCRRRQRSYADAAEPSQATPSPRSDNNNHQKMETDGVAAEAETESTGATSPSPSTSTAAQEPADQNATTTAWADQPEQANSMETAPVEDETQQPTEISSPAKTVSVPTDDDGFVKPKGRKRTNSRQRSISQGARSDDECFVFDPTARRQYGRTPVNNGAKKVRQTTPVSSPSSK